MWYFIPKYCSVVKRWNFSYSWVSSCQPDLHIRILHPVSTTSRNCHFHRHTLEHCQLHWQSPDVNCYKEAVWRSRRCWSHRDTMHVLYIREWCMLEFLHSWICLVNSLSFQFASRLKSKSPLRWKSFCKVKSSEYCVNADVILTQRMTVQSSKLSCLRSETMTQLSSIQHVAVARDLLSNVIGLRDLFGVEGEIWIETKQSIKSMTVWQQWFQLSSQETNFLAIANDCSVTVAFPFK